MSTEPRAATRPERGRATRRWLRSLIALLLLGALYVAPLLRPQMFFSYARDGAPIDVLSDEPIPESAGVVVSLAASRLRRSPLFDATQSYPVYVCNSGWRWSYFSGFNGRSRAFQTPLGRAVFTRSARWDSNQLAGPDGRDGPRSLDVYLAHEITHRLVADHLGVVAARRLPAWLREGYPEYVARRDTFDYDRTRARLLEGDEKLESRRTDPYLKYLLLVTHLLEREGMELSALLNDPPGSDEVEVRVRAGGPPR